MSRVMSALAFLACIVLANAATQRYGLRPGVFGAVTAGTYFAGATFTLRDAVHETAGRAAVLVLIVAGAALSWFVAPSFAVASGVAFLVSETCDLVVYEPLRRRHWRAAVRLSGLVGAAVDTWLFLAIADLSAGHMAVLAQVATKLLMVELVMQVLEARRSEVVPA